MERNISNGNGDLIHRMYLEIDGTPGNDKANVNATSITDVELEIGGQRIDKQTGQFMNVWAHLTEPNPSCHLDKQMEIKHLEHYFKIWHIWVVHLQRIQMQ